MKRKLKQYKITFQVLWKLFRMNIRLKPFNELSLFDYFDLDDIIKNSDRDNPIKASIQILSILLDKDEDIIREFIVNKFTMGLLAKWLLIIFKEIKYKRLDHSNSTFSDFIDNDKLLSMGKKYDAMKVICERNKIDINKSQDCIEYYLSYIDYCNEIKLKFNGIFVKEDEEEIDEEEQVNTFSANQNKGKEQAIKNWLWYSIIDDVSNGDITKYDEILEMTPEKVFTNLGYRIFKNNIKT